MSLLEQRSIKWYGCRRDQRDPRDHLFAYAQAAMLPAAVDLRTYCPPVMDQGALGSCVAHGTTLALRYLLKKNSQKDHAYARLQLYYDARWVEGTPAEDSGCEIRDAIKCVAKYGVAHEALWPYNINKFSRKPSLFVYADALRYQALAYQRVSVSTVAVKQALYSGFPVIVGLTLFESFESDQTEKTGVVTMPDIQHEKVVGGHCMAVVGYGQHPGYFTVQNSWNTDWGDKGFCYLPEAMVGSSDFGADYWIITKAEQ